MELVMLAVILLFPSSLKVGREGVSFGLPMWLKVGEYFADKVKTHFTVKAMNNDREDSAALSARLPLITAPKDNAVVGASHKNPAP